MTFAGFPKETLSYLKALNANNDKAWFEANRKTYEDFYLAPALELIQSMEPLISSLDPPHQAVPKLNKSLWRINRDTRFSKDKTPYQPRIHIVFWTGNHPNRSAGIHLVFAHDHFGYGAGHWAFEKEALERYRQAVLEPGPRSELGNALADAREIGCDLGEPELARLPRLAAGGLDNPDEGTADLLRRKGLVARTHSQSGHNPRLFTDEAGEMIADLCNALAPLDRWIYNHVDKSD